MALGERIRKLRVERGLSQRQLCGDKITRNMLSQIENGSARPSMDTLRYLAQQLGLPLSYFLEEEGTVSVNQSLMAEARQAFAQRQWETVRSLLQKFQSPDEIFTWEKELLLVKTNLALAQQAIEEKRGPYARQLLREAKDQVSPYCGRELELQRQLLLAKAGEAEEAMEFPELSQMLRIKAAQALEKGEFVRAQAYLEAEDTPDGAWYWLRGQVFFAAGEYQQAAQCFHKVEEEMGRPAYEKLEQCYQAMEDYKMAYTYACKQK